MFTAEQYRAKASEFDGLLRAAESPAEVAELRDLKQSYVSLAENLDWMAANGNKTVSSDTPAAPRKTRQGQPGPYAEQENILRCLGAAVILKWNTIPTKLQRALFEAASSVQANGAAAPSRDVLAQFLHDHKDDARKPGNGT